MAKLPPPLPGQLELVRPPAPGNLELVRRFINTRDRERDFDALGTPASLVTWLREQGLADGKLSATRGDVARALELRERLRGLARRNNGSDCDCDAAAAVLESASARSRFTTAFDPSTGTSTLVPTAGGVDGALGRIVAAVHVAMLERSWSRLKACAGDACVWAYYDHSKNGCSRWCSAETCGNRSKVKRYRERQVTKRPFA